MKTGTSIGLWLALLLYAIFAVGSVRAVGAVGEVDIGWALAAPPRVLVQWSPPVESADGGALGPLEARQTRPLESLSFGPVRVPLAVNSYTGGAADWPARAARALTGSRTAGVAVHLGLGALLLVLAHRFLRFHGTPTSAGGVALLLATDWSYVFFKRVLGGTELLLQAAGLLVLWALWSRRWKGGRHGTVALALGIGLGLGAKVTFVATLGAFAVAAVATRWDRPKLKPPEPVRPLVLVLIPLLCTAPLWVSLLHHATSVHGPQVLSHDTVGLQLQRLTSASAMGRESWVNLARFLGDPLGWLADAWGAAPRHPWSAGRTWVFAVAAAGAALEWKDRTHSPSAALLRWLSIAVPLQLVALFLLNRDLHHLAQATVPLALFTALGVDRVAGELARARSPLRAAATALGLAPAMAVGAVQLRETDAVVRTARAHSFTAAGQAELGALLRDAQVRRLVVVNYEMYGLLEQLVPDVGITHGWGAASRRDKDVDGLRDVARGGHYLWVRPSAPFVYDWHAPGVGVEVASLHDTDGAWAVLYRVD